MMFQYITIKFQGYLLQNLTQNFKYLTFFDGGDGFDPKPRFWVWKNENRTNPQITKLSHHKV